MSRLLRNLLVLSASLLPLPAIAQGWQVTPKPLGQAPARYCVMHQSAGNQAIGITSAEREHYSNLDYWITIVHPDVATVGANQKLSFSFVVDNNGRFANYGAYGPFEYKSRTEGYSPFFDQHMDDLFSKAHILEEKGWPLRG